MKIQIMSLIAALALTSQVQAGVWRVQYATAGQASSRITLTDQRGKGLVLSGPAYMPTCLQKHYGKLVGQVVKARNITELKEILASITLAYSPEADVILELFGNALGNQCPVNLANAPDLKKYFTGSGRMNGVFLARLMGRVAASSNHKVRLVPKPSLPADPKPSQRAILVSPDFKLQVILAPSANPITYITQ